MHHYFISIIDIVNSFSCSSNCSKWLPLYLPTIFCILFIPYPCFLSVSFFAEIYLPFIILGGIKHELIHLINIVSFFLLTISSIYLLPFDLAQFLAASYALDNIQIKQLCPLPQYHLSYLAVYLQQILCFQYNTFLYIHL